MFSQTLKGAKSIPTTVGTDKTDSIFDLITFGVCQ
jgi:hypothetical protein